MKVTIHTLDQRTPAWHQLRLGRLTGSRAADALATIKSGEAAARRDYRVELVAERLTGTPTESGFVSQDMERGIALEADARDAYVSDTGQLLDQSGFVSSDDVMAGCSLDGHTADLLLLVEIKCPRPANHLDVIDGGIPKKYIPQLTHNLWVTGADEIDFVSYCPVFPPKLRLSVHRFTRLDADLVGYEQKALQFLTEVDEMFSTLKERS